MDWIKKRSRAGMSLMATKTIYGEVLGEKEDWQEEEWTGWGLWVKADSLNHDAESHWLMSHAA